ncbi:MAG: DNA repair protein RecN, partial [Rhodovibrionaceae bacterium]
GLREEMRERLLSIDSGSERLTALSRQVQAARGAYLDSAEKLSAARKEAAGRLDAAVNRELPPLKLEKARFVTAVERLSEDAWGPNGLDRIAFQVSTNPGAAPGPIAKIASGGELSRFLLALKVVLAEISPAGTLVFDEVDSGIGGATADAVGERLARLAERRQVLVVTHSPQVAARGSHHWRVSKETSDKDALTRVAALDRAARREEVARMLSGATVTEEARAQAERLMDPV